MALYVPLYRHVSCVACDRPASALWLSETGIERGRRVRFNEITPCGCRIYRPFVDSPSLPHKVRR